MTSSGCTSVDGSTIISVMMGSIVVVVDVVAVVVVVFGMAVVVDLRREYLHDLERPFDELVEIGELVELRRLR